MKKSVKYSQNFLKSRKLIKELIDAAKISSNDTVYEIGAGKGIITDELLKKADRVVAFELDKRLFDKLNQIFKNKGKLRLIAGDFLQFKLPDYSYKVFSNIPFNITAAIIKKLTFAENPPVTSHLIIQKEAAKKFTGKPFAKTNSLMAALLHPWFEFFIRYEFKKSDFNPKPSVDIVLLEIKKRNKPLIDNFNQNKYEDFIAYSFSQFKPNVSEGLSKILGKQAVILLANQSGFSPMSKPSELNFKDWFNLFKLFLKQPVVRQALVNGSQIKLLKQQQKIKIIHRTRNDKSWRKYSSHTP